MGEELQRAISASQLLTIKNKKIEMPGAWGECVGQICREGSVFIWGNSGNGKSSCAMSFCRALLETGLKGLYVSKEEKRGMSLQNTAIRYNMGEFGSRLQFIDKDKYPDLLNRLKKTKQPDFIVIDSIQRMQIAYSQFIELLDSFPNILFIFVSKSKGSDPRGSTAEEAMYDSDLKIWVEGYRAFTKGRFFGEKGYYDIWPQKAQLYWGKSLKNQKNDEND